MPKITLPMMLHVFGLFFAVAACGVLQSCASVDEVVRVHNDSIGVDAVVLERNGGATTTFSYEVHIVGRGEHPSASTEVARLERAARNKDAYGVNLKWTNSQLFIEYLSATKAEITRTVSDSQANKIVVVLLPGVEDPNAPAGGMLYNLRRH